MAQRYNTFDLHHMSNARVMTEKISMYQDDIAFRKIGRQGSCSVEMDTHTLMLYPGKYGPEILVGVEHVEANVFANSFSKMSEQSPRNLQAEGWIYGPPWH